MKIGTKETAEAALRELPSVLGAFVREDVNGHPREVHLLVGPGPEVRHLARDVRELLEERLGVRVDQRVISIAQLADNMAELPLDVLEFHALPQTTTARAAAPAAPTRLIYEGLDAQSRGGRVRIRVRVSWRGQEFTGEREEIESALGRIRAAAAAALHAASAACGDRLRLELETASLVRALDREHVLVAALAVSPLLGRRPLPLAGAHPIESDAESAAALAALKASNRVLALGMQKQR